METETQLSPLADVDRYKLQAALSQTEACQLRLQLATQERQAVLTDLFTRYGADPNKYSIDPNSGAWTPKNGNAE